MVFLRSEIRVCGNATFSNFNLNIKFSYIIISKDVSRLMIVLGSKINEKSIWGWVWLYFTNLFYLLYLFSVEHPRYWDGRNHKWEQCQWWSTQYWNSCECLCQFRHSKDGPSSNSTNHENGIRFWQWFVLFWIDVLIGEIVIHQMNWDMSRRVGN